MTKKNAAVGLIAPFLDPRYTTVRLVSAPRLPSNEAAPRSPPHLDRAEAGVASVGWRHDHGTFFRVQTASLKYSYMLGGMVSLCSLAMCLRTISEYRKRSPQMRQCHWSRAKMYGRHSELFGSSLGLGILINLVSDAAALASAAT